MTKAIIVYLAALLLWLTPFKVHAFEYEVDMPNSTSKYENIRINIDGCDSFFPFTKKEFESLTKLPRLEYERKLQAMIVKAIEHSQNGCK